MWNNLSTANMWKTILLTYDKAIHFIKLRKIFVLCLLYLQKCFLQEEFAQFHQEVQSRSQPVVLETQFHLELNSPPQLIGRGHLVPSWSEQTDSLHYLQDMQNENIRFIIWCGHQVKRNVAVITINVLASLLFWLSPWIWFWGPWGFFLHIKM